jgi:Zn-dependent peptidase ImmA (M78 family)
MKYKALYIELAELLTRLKCKVCDYDFWGYCNQTKTIRAFIVIKPDMSYKSKFLTLAHEAGHLFNMGKNQEFIWSKNPRTEEEANQFALQLLNIYEIDPTEYCRFYEKAKKKAKKRNKSWFEI